MPDRNRARRRTHRSATSWPVKRDALPTQSTKRRLDVVTKFDTSRFLYKTLITDGSVPYQETIVSHERQIWATMPCQWSSFWQGKELDCHPAAIAPVQNPGDYCRVFWFVRHNGHPCAAQHLEVLARSQHSPPDGQTTAPGRPRADKNVGPFKINDLA